MHGEDPLLSENTWHNRFRVASRILSKITRILIWRPSESKGDAMPLMPDYLPWAMPGQNLSHSKGRENSP